MCVENPKSIDVGNFYKSNIRVQTECEAVRSVWENDCAWNNIPHSDHSVSWFEILQQERKNVIAKYNTQ